MYLCLIQKTCEFSALEAYQELEDFRQETVIKHGQWDNSQSPHLMISPLFSAQINVRGFFQPSLIFPDGFRQGPLPGQTRQHAQRMAQRQLAAIVVGSARFSTLEWGISPVDPRIF